MLPQRQTKGFVLVCKPDRVVDTYNASELARKNITYLRQIRSAMSCLNPRNYRGISRDSLEPWSSIDEELLKKGTSTLVDLEGNDQQERYFLK